MNYSICFKNHWFNCKRCLLVTVGKIDYAHATIFSDNMADLEIGYSQHIDIGSFIDYFLVNELTVDVDGYRLSTFMHMDKNSKIRAGPVWDYNLALLVNNKLQLINNYFH